MSYTELVGRAGDALRFRGPDGAECAVRPRLVVNAAGPWIDRVNAALGAPSRLIGGTRGSHVLLDHPALVAALNGRMIYFEADDGRILLVFDYLGRALVGSTDIPAADPDAVVCGPNEIAYFIASLSALLPGLRFHAGQIVHAYAGIRPLPVSDAATPGLISRDHSAPVAEPDATRPFPVISLVGGKWTTFRGFAEEVADEILARLGHARRTDTRDRAIGGGRDFPSGAPARAAWIAAQAEVAAVAAARVDTLLARYGTVAAAVLADRGTLRDDDRLTDAPSYSQAELGWIARNERVVHLSDIVLRRTTLAITGQISGRDLDTVAAIAAQALGWPADRTQREIDETRAVLTHRHLMRLT